MTAPSFSNSPGSKVASQARGWSFQSRAPLFSPNGHPRVGRDLASSIALEHRQAVSRGSSNQIPLQSHRCGSEVDNAGACQRGRGRARAWAAKDGCRPRPPACPPLPAVLSASRSALHRLPSCRRLSAGSRARSGFPFACPLVLLFLLLCQRAGVANYPAQRAATARGAFCPLAPLLNLLTCLFLHTALY